MSPGPEISTSEQEARAKLRESFLRGVNELCGKFYQIILERLQSLENLFRALKITMHLITTSFSLDHGYLIINEKL